MSALLRGHLAGARALLERGADPRVRDRHGDTCVTQMISGIYAFRGGPDDRDALDLLDTLLRAGVDARAKGRYGRDAMSIAASKGLRDVLAVLQRHGVPIDAADSHGLTPLQQAWIGRHTGQVAWLLQQAAPVDFHSAVALGHSDAVRAQLDQRPALIANELHELRAAPLGIALRQGQAEMVRLLLEFGADPNGPDPDSGSLRNALRNLPDPSILHLLIEHGADLDAADGDGNTALNIAARDDRLNLAKLLLEAGADPNARTERGYTVMVFAHSDAMKALLRRFGGVER
jgi:ankyrin repeat protein